MVDISTCDFLVGSAVSGGAGGVILILAALGIYGVVGLMVAARTREIAVRVALGASRRRVLGMILFDVVKLAMPGVAVGLVITAALIRLNGEKMGIAVSNLRAPCLRHRRRDCHTRRSPRQPRPCTPRRVGPADGGHTIGVGFSEAGHYGLSQWVRCLTRL